MWYVIQTTTGKEEDVKLMIEKTVPRALYEDCKIIYSQRKRKYLQKWHHEKRLVFPGYIFLITDNIDDVFIQLKNVPAMTKLLGTGGQILPLYEEEVQLLKRLSGDDGVIEMSYGIQVGDKVTITYGSLKGLESTIRKIDRHKKKGYIEVEILNEMRTIEIGLEIISKS